jgi:HSP20 family protein
MRLDPFRGITRWDPMRDLEEVAERLGRAFGRPTKLRSGDEALTAAEWSPAVDISETDKEYLIKAELPEVKKDDVKVAVQNDILTIQGERKAEKEEKNTKHHRIERSYGYFERSFSLPDDADPAKIDATFKDGVLTVRLAKSEKARPKSVEVKVS